jgi:hypothetical protein
VRDGSVHVAIIGAVPVTDKTWLWNPVDCGWILVRGDLTKAPIGRMSYLIAKPVLTTEGCGAAMRIVHLFRGNAGYCVSGTKVYGDHTAELVVDDASDMPSLQTDTAPGPPPRFARTRHAAAAADSHQSASVPGAKTTSNYRNVDRELEYNTEEEAPYGADIPGGVRSFGSWTTYRVVLDHTTETEKLVAQQPRQVRPNQPTGVRRGAPTRRGQSERGGNPLSTLRAGAQQAPGAETFIAGDSTRTRPSSAARGHAGSSSRARPKGHRGGAGRGSYRGGN